MSLQQLPTTYGGEEIDPLTGLPVSKVNPGMGFPSPAAPAALGLMGRLSSALGGSQGLLNIGGNLLAASGPSPTRVGLGQAVGGSLLANQQFQRQQGQDMLAQMLLKVKLAKAGQAGQTNSQKDYEYAKTNGFTGTFEEWKKVASAQPQTPAAIQQYEYWKKLPTKEEQDAYLTVQRNMQPFQVADMAGGKIVFNRATGNWEQATTASQEAAGQGEVKQGEAAGAALGTAQGNIQGGIETKGSNAVTTQGTLDVAEPLIDIATGSAAGAARDKVAAVFGGAPDGAKAIAALKVLQANLMTSMPRMEGPQSDRDVQLYREAAGQIGDPMVPAGIKKAAVQTIRGIQQRYQERAGTPPAPGAVRRKKFNPATGKIE
jgi:hypothetical protein